MLNRGLSRLDFEPRKRDPQGVALSPTRVYWTVNNTDQQRPTHSRVSWTATMPAKNRSRSTSREVPKSAASPQTPPTSTGPPRAKTRSAVPCSTLSQPARTRIHQRRRKTRGPRPRRLPPLLVGKPGNPRPTPATTSTAMTRDRRAHRPDPRLRQQKRRRSPGRPRRLHRRLLRLLRRQRRPRRAGPARPGIARPRSLRASSTQKASAASTSRARGCDRLHRPA